MRYFFKMGFLGGITFFNRGEDATALAFCQPVRAILEIAPRLFAKGVKKSASSPFKKK